MAVRSNLNSTRREARRANALLRSSHLKDPLHPLIGPQGVISPNFPRDLTALFALDAAAAKALNEEYGLPDIGESRERNLNRFMQYCGVAYQMVSLPFNSLIRFLGDASIQTPLHDPRLCTEVVLFVPHLPILSLYPIGCPRTLPFPSSFVLDSCRSLPATGVAGQACWGAQP